MNHITLDCPNCEAESKVVGDPHVEDGGHTGRWYCFECRHQGTYELAFSDSSESEPAE